MPKAPPPLPPTSIVGARAYHPRRPLLDPREVPVRARPFRFEGLERFPRAVADIHRALLHVLPETLFEPGLVATLRQTVREHTRLEFDLWLDGMQVLKINQLRAVIPGTAFVAVIGLPPLNDKLLVEIDLAFVYRAVDELLAGKSLAVDVHRPLTEIEHGVFSFLLLKVLQLFQGQTQLPEQVTLRLEDTRNDIKSCADILHEQEIWICASWKMTYDLDVGSVRVLMPSSLCRHAGLDRDPATSGLHDRALAFTRERLHRLAGVEVEAPVEIGRIELSLPDLDGLEPGDIIVLEDTAITRTEEGVFGPAKMRVGLGLHAVIHGEVTQQDTASTRQVVFQVSRIEPMPQPRTRPIGDALSRASPEEAIGLGASQNPESARGAAEAYGDGSGVAYAYGDDDADESDDGQGSPEALFEEDYAVDDEDAGPEDDYGAYEEGYEEAYEEGYEEGSGEDYPPEQSPESEHHGEPDVGAAGDDNLDEAHPLLGDIPVSIAVELGRARLTADEVIRLKAGLIVELGRGPNEPVDLVVNGRMVAKGELVEIEGQLGVRILQLTRGDR